MADERPNILLIMTDQHRGDCLGCDGHPVLETPTLDQLADEGVRFRHAYSAVPSCVPARASLLTGMNQWHTGILGMGHGGKPIHDRFVHTLPGELAKAGYHTQGIGKMHFHPQRALNGFHNTILDEGLRAQPGFVSDYMTWFQRNRTGEYGPYDHGIQVNSCIARPWHLAEYLHPTAWTAQQAIQWLDRRDPNKPFFLKVSFDRPHSPYDPPPYYYEMYRDKPFYEPHVGEWAAVHEKGDPGIGVRHAWCDRTNPWRGRRTEEEIRRARACYYGSITFIDHQISLLLSTFAIKENRAYRNTSIIFLSDHGDMLGDHHLWRKGLPYEGATRIPMILRPPMEWAGPRGVVLDPVVEVRDVMPTLLDAAGVPIPCTCDGQSMLALAKGERPPWREYLHGEHCYSHHPAQANHYLTDGKTKYIWLASSGEEQLFDLSTDPGECNNLASRAGSEQLLRQWRKRLMDELDARKCGLVKDGKLVRMLGDQIVESPHYGTYGCMSGVAA